ncbi:M20/M25/M40 family metallo-hydrolase [Altererythrobacter lutimaris]|uniref:M28 family peptidase n=1 Tax=Altererythrobacter lutimaris TaxID=2743979 RepID=A0A850HA97_9SPHN|nr:M20/M25/M40 family metallo-hydrolase [Altererythrobacter lutimaris]NVE93881.1 M28 family peptidase [Altererythrobacter lutimaris]
MPLRASLIGLLCVFVTACATPSGVSKSEFAEIERAMAEHINVLASDGFEGRRPGTRGERLTLDYLRDEFEKRGLVSGTNDPANPWFAPVELVRTKAVASRVEFVTNGEPVALDASEAFATTNLRRSLLEYAPLLFAGASLSERPEDELVGQVVVLTSSPMRSAGYSKAAFDAGAAAVLQVVENEEVIERFRRFLGTERFRLESETRDELTAYVTRDALTKIIGEEQFAALEQAASDPEFAGQLLPITARIEASRQSPSIVSHNFIGKIQGTKPEAGALILMGHWDHFGQCGDEADPDRICNGAIDNASGLAVMIELSARLQARGPHDRDIYFLGTTAEEWGLLGAKAFIARPPLPLDEVVGIFNFDTIAIAGRGSPVVFLGEGYTALDPFVLKAIDRAGRDLGPRELAEQFVRRQDGWAFLEAGIPSIMLTGALGAPEMQAYFQSRYHNAQDNPGELVLSGAVEDMLLHEDLVVELADAERYPAGGE